MHYSFILTIIATFGVAYAAPSRQEGTEWNVPNPLASVPAQVITAIPYRTNIPAPAQRNVPRNLIINEANELHRFLAMRLSPSHTKLVTRGIDDIVTVQTDLPVVRPSLSASAPIESSLVQISDNEVMSKKNGNQWIPTFRNFITFLRPEVMKERANHIVKAINDHEIELVERHEGEQENVELQETFGRLRNGEASHYRSFRNGVGHRLFREENV